MRRPVDILLTLFLALAAGCGQPDEASDWEDFADSCRLPGKADQAFLDDYASALVNDANGRIDYSCDEVAGLDAVAHASQHGLDLEAEERAFAEAVRFEAFRKVATLKATLTLMRGGSAQDRIQLADVYYRLPGAVRYRVVTDRLNRSLDLHRVLHERGMFPEESHASVHETVTRVDEALDDLARDLQALELMQPDLDPEVYAERRRGIEGRILALQTVLRTADPDRRRQRELYQAELRVAAFEIELLRAVKSFCSPYELKHAAIWENARDRWRPLTAEERIAQLFGQYPILAVDDGWLLFGNDLAERIYPLVSPDRSAAAWANELSFECNIDLGPGVMEFDVDCARRFVSERITPAIGEIVRAPYDPVVQEQVDWALVTWEATVDDELVRLAGRDGDDLLRYVDLIDAALMNATPARRELWLSLWCRGARMRQLAEYGKTAVYLGAGVVALVTTVLGQLEIAVPLSMLLTAAFVVDAVVSAVRAVDFADAHVFFWLSYEGYAEQEREAVFNLLFAALGVTAEAVAAAKLLHGWSTLQTIKGRLGHLERELTEARSLVAGLSAEIKLAEATGASTALIEEQLARAALRLGNVSDSSRVATRTLAGVREAEGLMGRVKIAHLMDLFPSEGEAVAFFEMVTRNAAAWDELTRAGYRNWLRAVRDARGSARLPPVCF